MGFLQNSIPTVTTSIMQCCLSVTVFPFVSLLDLALPLDLMGYPCFGAGELLRVQHGSGHPRKSCLAQVSRRVGTAWQLGSGEMAMDLQHCSRAKGREHP